MNLLTSKTKIFIGMVTLGLIAASVLTYTKTIGATEKIRPRRGDVVESIYGLGTVAAEKVYHLRAGIALSVQKLFVAEGDFVKPSDPLIKLDENVMRSPIQGTVTSVNYKEGELVMPQVPVITVTNLTQLFLEVSLEQQSVLRIKKDQPVFVSFESLRNEKFEGIVESVYPRDSQFILHIQLQKWPTGVLPGMTADVAILVGRKKDVLLVPLRSLVAGQLTRLRDGKKERIAVKLGIIDGEWGELISENVLETDELLVRK
jgi:macrolide-specific efflux system membrane fusion protein